LYIIIGNSAVGAGDATAHPSKDFDIKIDYIWAKSKPYIPINIRSTVVIGNHTYDYTKRTVT